VHNWLNRKNAVNLNMKKEHMEKKIFNIPIKSTKYFIRMPSLLSSSVDVEF